MATLTKGKTFTNGETVTPQKLHELVDLGTISGIVNADISASAAIADGKLAQITTAGKVLPSAVQGTAVVTADSRLSDARTPVPHTHAISDTTGLQTALDGKQAAGSYAAASHNHDASNITSGTLANDRLPARLQADAQTISDWNDAVENGWYQGSQAANAPDGVLDKWLGYVEVHNAIWVTQTVHSFTADAPANTHIWRRSSLDNGSGSRVWNAWHKLQLSQAEQDARYQASGSYAAASHTHDATNITGKFTNFNFGILTEAGFGGFETTNEIGTTVVSDAGRNSVPGAILARWQRTNNSGVTSTIGTITSAGSGASTTGVAYNTSSDYRLKTNIEPLTAAVSRLLQIPVHRFNWLADPTSPKVDGFLAHEAQAIVPESVTGHKDEVDAEGKPIHQGIDQSKLVPLLVAAVQELAARVAALEAR